MAEKSFPWTESGVGDGTTGGYTALEWGEIWRRTFLPGHEAYSGVIRGHGNSLAVSGTASPLTVATGAAYVYGKHYYNDAALNLEVATPTVGTTGGHVVLELDWNAQTVRAKAIRNTDGNSAIPALTQNVNTVWQIRLATFSITTGGVITVTDARRWAFPYKGTPGRVPFFDSDGVIADDAGLVYNAAADHLTVGSLSSGAPLSISVTNAETDPNAANYMRFSVAGGLVARLYRDYNGSQNYLGLESFNVGGGVPAPIVLQEFGGNVGIGTPSPQARVHIAVTNAETDTNAADYLNFNVAGGRVGRLYRDYNGSQNYLGLESFNVGNSAKTPVVLQEFGGNVGIGTTNPTATLDVSGSAKVSSTLSVGNNLTVTGSVAATGNMTRDGAPVPNLYRRQGGSESSWATGGGINYMPGPTRMQVGVTSVTVSGASDLGSFVVQFPVAFSNTPIVLVSIVSSTPSNPIATVRALNVTASAFSGQISQDIGSGDHTYTVSWLAIGPE